MKAVKIYNKSNKWNSYSTDRWLCLYT